MTREDLYEMQAMWPQLMGCDPEMLSTADLCHFLQQVAPPVMPVMPALPALPAGAGDDAMPVPVAA